MLSIVASSAVSVSLAQTQAPPKFADSFYVGQQSVLVQNQNGYTIDRGVCCDSTSGVGCKVESQSAGSDTREITSKQVMRQDSARGSIVTWGGDVKKQMAVVPGSATNSSHKWACAVYCPYTNSFASTLAIGEGKNPKISDLGQATITQPASIGNTTKSCEHYKFVERLAIIPMSQTDFYVDQSADPPAPFYKHLILEPFGKKFGFEKSYFVGYQATDNTDYFDIDLNPKVCKLSKKCQSQVHSSVETERMLLGRTMHDAVSSAADELRTSGKAKVAAETAKAAAKALPTPPNVTFTGDFIAQESSISLIDQGGRHGLGKNPKDICCTEDEPGCQVQFHQSKGTRYFDYTHQRTRIEDELSGAILIDDYSVHKTYSVTSSGGVETCKEYCPIDVNDTMRPFDPFNPFDPIKDLGSTTIDGKKAEHYHWAEKILHIITMSQTDLYVDISDKQHAVPLFLSETIEPMGRQIGKNNHSWANFTYTAVPAAKFNVSGVDTCPMAKKCGSHEAQMNSMRSRNYYTLLRSLQAPEQHSLGFGPQH